MRETRTVLLVSLLLALVLFIYLGHFHNGFHFDDQHTVVHNPYIRDLHNIPRFFTDARTFSISPVNRSYRPIVSATLALDYWLGGGLDPLYFHLGTFCLFLLQLILMFALFWFLCDLAHPDPRNRLVALLATAWYGIHPAMAETVNYIIQRADLYSVLTIVAGILIYAQGGRARKFGLYLLPVAAGILSKPTALIFPAILFLYVYLFETDGGGRGLYQSLLRSLPALAMTGALTVFSSAMTPKEFNPGAASAYAYRITQPLVALRYFELFFLPGGLTADSDMAPVSSIWIGGAWLGFVFLTALLGAAVWAARKPEWRPVSFGLWWFLLGLVPTSLYPLADVENHHRLFLPFVGLVIAAVWPVALWVYHFPPRRAFRIGLAAVCTVQFLVLCLGTLQRNQVWRSDESLWYDVTVKSPHDARGLLNYAVYQSEQGHFARAVSFLEQARSQPSPSSGLIELNLGIALAGLQRDAEVEGHFQTALRLMPSDPRCHTRYAEWLWKHGREKEAIDQLTQASDLSPDAVDSVYLLMRIFAKRGSWPVVERLANWLLQRFPAEDNAKAYLLMAAQHDARLYVERLRTPENFVNLSALYYEADDFASAVTAASEAIKLRPDDPAAYGNLAAAYRAAGDCSKAVEASHQALRLRANDGSARQTLSACEEGRRLPVGDKR